MTVKGVVLPELKKLGMVVVTPFKMPTVFLPAAAGCEATPVEALEWWIDRGSPR
jgi:hypothetical protein